MCWRNISWEDVSEKKNIRLLAPVSELFTLDEVPFANMLFVSLRCFKLLQLRYCYNLKSIT